MCRNKIILISSASLNSLSKLHLHFPRCVCTTSMIPNKSHIVKSSVCEEVVDKSTRYSNLLNELPIIQISYERNIGQAKIKKADLVRQLPSIDEFDNRESEVWIKNVQVHQLLTRTRKFTLALFYVYLSKWYSWTKWQEDAFASQIDLRVDYGNIYAWRLVLLLQLLATVYVATLKH